jgi:sulfate adenylyltransferase
MQQPSIQLRQDQYLELEKIGLGAFLPLNQFMTEEQFQQVAKEMHLPDGSPFTIPVYLDVDKQVAELAQSVDHFDLLYAGTKVGEIVPESIFTCDKSDIARHVFGTSEDQHPGVNRFYHHGDWFIGGKTTLLQRVDEPISRFELTPEQAKQKFAELGWKTVVGFQTRNVPHRAHEYLQRTALEHVDGLFVQPLVGQKKKGDYAPDAVIRGYQALIEGFYPKERVLLGILSTSMRYAGPREAVFHALIRRNYGCTHFIVGRDHAGVGNYYEKYAAHAMLRRFEAELGINIMYLHGPFYCESCDGIATEHTCCHIKDKPEVTSQISGTLMRRILSGGSTPDRRFFRPEILDALAGCELFID